MSEQEYAWMGADGIVRPTVSRRAARIQVELSPGTRKLLSRTVTAWKEVQP